jgi:hypothetical protein
MQQMPIPQQIEPLWAALYEEVVNLHAYWIIFEQLFGKSQARHELRYASARHLFRVVEDALGTDVQLTLSKLSDPAAKGRYQNATLPRLFDEVALMTNDPLIGEIEAHLKAFNAACNPIRERRDRLIAHSDLSTVLGDSNRPLLSEPTVNEIEAALTPLRDFMNAIALAFGETATVYEHFISREDGDDLVLLLKMAHRYMDLQKADRIPWDDWQQSGYRDA